MLWNDSQPIFANSSIRLWLKIVHFRAQMSRKYYINTFSWFTKETLILFDTIINNNLWQIKKPIQTEDTLQVLFFFQLGKIFPNLHQLGIVSKVSLHLVCLRAKVQLWNWARGADPTQLTSGSVSQTSRVSRWLPQLQTHAAKSQWKRRRSWCVYLPLKLVAWSFSHHTKICWN